MYIKSMSKGDFKPSKSMGQNFLIDDNIPQKIVRLSGIDKACGVLEVGPGYGALTERLAEAARHITAVELDTRLVPQLRERFASNQNVTILQADILRADIKALADETLPVQHRHVCANLPYSITTPAITRLIDSGVFETITVMVQKEVAERICAAPGSREYGAFTVYVNYHALPEKLFNIPPECFSPRPKVTSSVVRMAMRKERCFCGHILDEDGERRFTRVVRAAFGQRRKTLVNALYAAFQNTHSKDALTRVIEGCGFDAKIRGEMLSTPEYVRLSAELDI